jgi:hypothetical protein
MSSHLEICTHRRLPERLEDSRAGEASKIALQPTDAAA